MMKRAFLTTTLVAALTAAGLGTAKSCNWSGAVVAVLLLSDAVSAIK